MAECGVRIRLKFQDAGLLTKQQTDQGLAQCWHLVRLDEVRTIADVASEISSTFNLGESCPGGLGLEVDGFALPPSQPAHLLKDSDLVRIRRRKEAVVQPAAEVHRYVKNDQHLIINRARYGSRGGREIRAIEEFEKETGGYKSEEEEGEMETDVTLSSGGRAMRVHGVTPFLLKELERSSKKRKRVKDIGTDSGKKKGNSDNGLCLPVDAKQEGLKANNICQHAGVNLRALEEFERELGGYESEREDEENEETDISLGGTKAVVPSEARPSDTPKEVKRRAKKQKPSEKELDHAKLDNDQVQQLQLLVNDGEEEQEVLKKKKKRKNSEVIVSRPTEDTVELVPAKSKKRKSPKSAEKAEARQNMADSGIAQPESSRQKRSKEKGKRDVMSAPKVGDDSWMDLEDTLMESDTHDDKQRNQDVAAKVEAANFSTPLKGAPSEEVHKPSRSARRKKAKRKWLREQQAKDQKGKTAKTSMEEDSVKLPPSNKEVMEVETVEELQPVVVRAGHIRFEPYEEENTGESPRCSLPVINMGEQFKSKRQGQNWGQEKTAEMQKGNRGRESGNDNSYQKKNSKCENRFDDLEIESLPPLQGVPQDGDVIAYRLVELTASWTPELSPFRIGVVVSLDGKTDGIKLAPHPDYPFRPTKDGELEDGAVEESEAYPLPYSDEGILETELSALVDLRLLERKLGPNGGQEDLAAGQDAKGEEMPNRGSAEPEDRPSSMPPLHQTGGPTEISGPNEARVENETHPVVIEGRSTQNPPQETMSTKAADDKEETEMEENASSSPDWQTVLTKELQRKKLEIRQKSVNAGCTEKNGEPEKTASAKSRKSKYLRSAGIGSIVARLRAEQAL